MNELIKTSLNKSHGENLHYLQLHNICCVNKLTFIVIKQIDDPFQFLKGGIEQKSMTTRLFQIIKMVTCLSLLKYRKLD